MVLLLALLELLVQGGEDSVGVVATVRLVTAQRHLAAEKLAALVARELLRLVVGRLALALPRWRRPLSPGPVPLSYGSNKQ